MKIIYHCYGGTHSSVTAAAIHLGQLPQNRLPSCRELLATPFFDRRENHEHGLITLMGIDDFGHEIYFVGRRGAWRLLDNLKASLIDIFNLPAHDYLLVNVLSKVNMSMRLGGMLSRGLKCTALGRPLVAWGTVRAYGEIVKLVHTIQLKYCYR